MNLNIILMIALVLLSGVFLALGEESAVYAALSGAFFALGCELKDREDLKANRHPRVL